MEKKKWLMSQGKLVYVALLVQAGARKNEVLGVVGEHLKIKIAAPAVEGAANEEIIRFFATLVGVKKSALSICKGEFFKRKVLAVTSEVPSEVEDKIRSVVKGS